MIGVIARADEHAWVREFFELFKTPWEFHRAARSYDVVLCADGAAREPGAKLVLIFGGAANPFDAELGLQSGAVQSNVTVEHDGSPVPIHGNCLAFGRGELPLAGTQGFAAVSQSRNGQQLVRVGFDLFAETRELLTRGQDARHARVPTLDHLIAMVRGWMVRAGIRFVEIPPVPAGYCFTACLTHDVDHPRIRHHKFDHTMLGFLQRAVVGSVVGICRGRLSPGQLGRNWLAVLKLPFVHLGLAKDFWKQTERYLELEKGLGSTFFVVPTKQNPGRSVNRNHSDRRATLYEAADIADDLRTINAAGGEVGVHGIDAWLDGASGRAERERVAKAAGTAGGGVRMHWLCFDEKSPAALEAAGFSYDSTVGYNECAGYRAGTLQVYRPAGAEQLLELPLHVMDTALFYPGYMNLSPQDATAAVQELLGHAGRFGGVLTINWHDRSLAPERLWDRFYVKLLDELRRQRAWCPTAGQAVGWFRHRRSAQIEVLPGADSRLRVRVKLAPRQKNLPGLRIRFHNAPGQNGPASGPVDVEFGDDFSEVGEVLEPPVGGVAG